MSWVVLVFVVIIVISWVNAIRTRAWRRRGRGGWSNSGSTWSTPYIGGGGDGGGHHHHSSGCSGGSSGCSGGSSCGGGGGGCGGGGSS
jgi:hypothetical protein